MIPVYEVTIGIPVYRSAKYIEASLLSALNQTYQDIEILIVDDAGDDGSMDIITNLKINHPRGEDIRILVNDKNMGISYSRNRIIDEARGRYLYFMDSDDTIEPNTIQLLYDALTSNHVQIAYGSYEIIDGIGHSPTLMYKKDALVLNGKDELAMYAFKNNHVFHVSVCNHLVDLFFLRQSNLRFVNACFWEDLVYTTELVSIIESSVLLPEITYHYYRHLGTLSQYHIRDFFDKEEILANIRILKYLKEICLKHDRKKYLPFLCYNIEMISFYTACHIIRNSHIIVPKVSSKEVQGVIRHPFPIIKIVSFKYKLLPNMVFWLLGSVPSLVFNPFIWVLGKIKRVL